MKTRIITAFIAFLLFANLVVFAQQGASISSFVPSTTQATASAFQITINGTGFEDNVQVSLGGMPCTIVASSATRIVANIPASANIEGNRELLLTRAGAVIVRTVYVIGAMRLPPPIVIGVVQDRGTLVIAGMNFVTGATVLLPGSPPTTGTVLALTATRIVAQFPPNILPRQTELYIPTMFAVIVRNPDGQISMNSGSSVGVKRNEAIFIQLYPNPATENITIQTSTNAPSVVTFILRNALGQELMRFTKALPSGQVSTPLDMHSFPAGAYFLEVQSGTERVVERLLKH